MSLGIFLTFVLFLYVSITSAVPSNLRTLNPINASIDHITSKPNTKTPNPLPEHPVICLTISHPPKLSPSDCGYVINILLSEPGIFKQRLFRFESYQTEDGKFVRARWQYGNCALSFAGKKNAAGQLLTFWDVARTANSILQKCITDVSNPISGVSLIGEPSQALYVLLEGFEESGSVAAENFNVSQQPGVNVSRRAIRSRHDSEDLAGSRVVENRDLLMGVSRVANYSSATSHSNLSEASPPRHPIHCFNPYIIHLPPAAAIDCSYVINQIILRLFDPTRELTFGFTDAADINLSRPEYQHWQFGQCMISVKSYDMRQIDTFRLLDVANTARRITTQCVEGTREKMGGSGNVGNYGKGFYLYVGGPLMSSQALSDDGVLLRGSIGAETIESV